MRSFSNPHILVIDTFHLDGHFSDGSLSSATHPATSIRRIPEKHPFSAQLKPLMGVIKSGLMFPPVSSPATRTLLLPPYLFSSTISHSGVVNYHRRLSEGRVTPHLTADEHPMWKDLEIWTRRIISGVTLGKSPPFSGPVSPRVDGAGHWDRPLSTARMCALKEVKHSVRSLGVLDCFCCCHA